MKTLHTSQADWLWAKHRISSGPSANRNSHAVPSGQGAAMPRATPGNRTRMAESTGKELTSRPECSHKNIEGSTQNNRYVQGPLTDMYNNCRTPPRSARVSTSVSFVSCTPLIQFHYLFKKTKQFPVAWLLTVVSESSADAAREARPLLGYRRSFCYERGRRPSEFIVN